ncbi:hypothetical protein FA13DRAFT_1175691 [Coprinellus micaceus]|uniref:Uncharacterized protein n=1 Tax=Coprinellus micaceus TaxID=71717 RepID=A0A4Y7STQ1_COPMI|nr:hypothetical protein FA13DRAFT_1175691 [Coprinellus micaceus]
MAVSLFIMSHSTIHSRHFSTHAFRHCSILHTSIILLLTFARAPLVTLVSISCVDAWSACGRMGWGPTWGWIQNWAPIIFLVGVG